MTVGPMNPFYVVLVYAHDITAPIPIGVMLVQEDVVYTKFLQDWSAVAAGAGDGIEILELLSNDLLEKAKEMGALQLVAYMEDTLSNIIQLSERYPVERGTDPLLTLDEIYARHIP